MHRHTIVIALDFSEYAEIVLEHGLDQAARHAEPDLHLVTVVGASSDADEAKRRLAALVLPSLQNIDCTSWSARLHVRTGVPHEEIAGLAHEVGADLVVVGRFGLHHLRGASLASRVVDAAPCPTLVIGLSGSAPAAAEQCPDCVAVRADSQGENWFCDAHHGAREHLGGTWVSAAWTGGGLMW